MFKRFYTFPKWFPFVVVWLFWLFPAYASVIDVDVTGSVTEGGNSNLTVTFSSNVPADDEYLFYWSIEAGTGNPLDPSSDFTSDSGGEEKVNINSSSYSLTLPLVDDSASEGTEVGAICLLPSNESSFPRTTFTYSSDYTNSGGEPCFNFSIIDNDTPPTISFNSGSSANSEAVSSASIPVSLSASWASTITVNYTVTGTATGGGTDYTLANGMLSFSSGTTTLPIPISSIVDDNIHEGDETVILTLSSPTVATLGSTTVHTYTITENETVPTLSIADISSLEGAFGVNSQPNVAVTLSHPSSQSVSFQWQTQDGTATSADSDYSSDSGTLYILSGDTSINVSPVIFGDDSFENDENFSLVLSNATNATIADNTSIVTIQNDDALPSLSVSSLGAIVEGGGNANVVVALDTPAGVDVSFNYATSDGTASAGVEYSSTSGTATIVAGSPDVTIPVPLTDNSIDNADKTFTFTITNPVQATIGTSSETFTILDDDAVVSIGDISVNETDSTATFTVTVQGPMTASTLDVDYTTVDGSALAGSDYTTKSGTLNFASSQAIPFNSAETQTIVVNLSDDAIVEGSENFDISLSNIVSTGSAIMPDNTGTATITDNEGTPTIQFNAASSSGAESASSAALQVDLSGASASAVTVAYAVTGTATGGGTDYTLADGTLTFNALSTSETITIASIIDDAIVEGSETVIVTLSSPSGASLGSNTAHTYTITDNEGTPTIQFNAASSSGAESASSAALQVDLSGASASAVTVAYAVTGTATGGGTDYTLADGTLTFNALSTSETITIASIIDDAIVEGSETVIVTLSSPSGASLGSNTAHTYTITDNDVLATTVSVSSAASVSEGAGTHSFTVSLSSVAASSLSVDYTTSNGTALAGSDYTSVSSTLNFATGEQTKTVSVTIIDDSDTEASESFSLTLSNPVNVTLGTSSASVSITDNDISIEQSLIDEAETYVRGVSDQLAQEKGHDLIEASHRLIRASLDSVMIQSSVLASKAEPNTPEPRTGFADSTSSQTSRQAFFSQPDTPIPDAQTTFKQNLVGAVKSLDVAADDGSHHAHFNYDLYTPLIRSNDRLITKIAAQTSKQKNGPEARRLIASFALEKKASDEQSAIGRFVHLTHENADFNTEYKGDKNTSGVNIGIYKVYTADVDVLNSAYFSAGISNTDLSLTKSGMLLDSSYLSYQFQTGFSVGRVYKAKRFAGILEFSIDALYDYQNGHDLNITYGISKFNRLMSGKGHHEIIARFEPKANFELGEIKNGKARILQVTPLLKCGTGSMSADCGGGLSAKVSSPFEGDKGHLSFGIRYEHYRDTDFMEYLMNINQNLFNSDQIKLNTELKVDTNDVLPSSSAGQYKVGSSLNVTF